MGGSTQPWISAVLHQESDPGKHFMKPFSWLQVFGPLCPWNRHYWVSHVRTEPGFSKLLQYLLAFLVLPLWMEYQIIAINVFSGVWYSNKISSLQTDKERYLQATHSLPWQSSWHFSGIFLQSRRTNKKIGKDNARLIASWVEVNSEKQPPLKQECVRAAPKCKSHICFVPRGLFGSWSLLQGMGGRMKDKKLLHY